MDKTVPSYGIMCHRFRGAGTPPEFLMIQRKDSVSFVEFVRGKYDEKEWPYLCYLLSHMTPDERNMVRGCSSERNFDALWKYMWSGSRRQSNEYYESKEKFYRLCERLVVNLADHADTLVTEPEWDFPKGRKIPDDHRRAERNDSLECALREFEEETGLDRGNIQVQSHTPIVLNKMGSNGTLYQTHLYPARCIVHTDDALLNNLGDSQAKEVRAVRWFGCDDVRSRLRSREQVTVFDACVKDVVLQAPCQ